jgi:preprotein translocase subunit SecG
MYTILVVGLHVVACFALILIVLLQTGRGAEMGAAFGGASQTLFGGTGGTTFLGKLTTGAAVVFMVTCLLLSYRPGLSARRSVMEDVPVQKETPVPAPVLPEAKPVQPMQPAPEPAPQAQAPAVAAPAPAPAAEAPRPESPPAEQKQTPPAAKPQTGKQEQPSGKK